MKVAEQIKTSKGHYTLTMKVSEGCNEAHVEISDPVGKIAIRLDRVDLDRIALLLSDHMTTGSESWTRKN